MKSELEPAVRLLREKMVDRRVERMASRKLVTEQDADCSPIASHKTFVNQLENSIIDSRWRAKKKDYLFDYDPDEILDRFKWFSNERVQQLIPNQKITHMPTAVIKTAR